MAFTLTIAREDYKCSLAEETLRSGASLRLRALGMSMLPTIWPGDHLFIESLRSEQVVVGDIVLVVRAGRFFIHRAVQKTGQAWIFRGDAMPKPDPWAENETLLGRVTSIERNGLVFVPRRCRSVLNRALGWILGHWVLALNIALGIESPRRQIARLAGRGIDQLEPAPRDAGF